MRVLILTYITMIAFAANSILNRLALAGGYIDAMSFGAVRLFAGAIILALLCIALRGQLRFGGPARVIGVIALLGYIFGFSAAYTALDAGLGALILFGMVQVTMFASALIAAEPIPTRRWIGAGLALAGLAWLMWPGSETKVSLLHGGLMAIAGVSWGLYSLAGRRASDALQATAGNFIIAAPVSLILLVTTIMGGNATPWQITGVSLAIISGAITSGLGYALWYAVLPKLDASTAAVAQLTVPVLALAAGVALLGEVLTLRLTLASLLVLGGVALSSMPSAKRDRSKA
ncbi:MAG: DMT family transporter [Pseudomonadota bacterium]